MCNIFYKKKNKCSENACNTAEAVLRYEYKVNICSETRIFYIKRAVLKTF